MSKRVCFVIWSPPLYLLSLVSVPNTACIAELARLGKYCRSMLVNFFYNSGSNTSLGNQEKWRKKQSAVLKVRINAGYHGYWSLMNWLAGFSLYIACYSRQTAWVHFPCSLQVASWVAIFVSQLVGRPSSTFTFIKLVHTPRRERGLEVPDWLASICKAFIVITHLLSVRVSSYAGSSKKNEGFLPTWNSY